MKKTIVHIIFDLGCGGAEAMLVQVLKELTEYNNIVVTLHENNHFKNDLVCYKYICLNKRSLWWLPVSVLKFRKIIKKYRPAIVHSHLPIPNYVARLATPRKIPLVTTIHTSVSFATDYKKWYICFLDKLTYHFRQSVIIGVSRFALNDYFIFLRLRPDKKYVLHTFINEKIFTKISNRKNANDKLKIISVGSLRKGKNYSFLIEAFSKINYSNIELHIFGNGPLYKTLQADISRLSLPIILKGQVNNIYDILPGYDLFVMPSKFEGFSVSVLEAMALKVPLLLSNIPAFKEQAENCATYFDLDNTNDFIEKLDYLVKHKSERIEKAEMSYKRVINNFTLYYHMTELRKIYSGILNKELC
jgi:glycosyltransferase involved in cell wall biosynthesis